jgi:hypothetical protein
MILPTKHISTEHSLLGIGAELLKALERPHTVTGLWDEARQLPGVVTFERFTLALDLLYACGAVIVADGLLRRADA